MNVDYKQSAKKLNQVYEILRYFNNGIYNDPNKMYPDLKTRIEISLQQLNELT